MSMIEKFLKSKSMLRENLIEVREEALRAAEPKADALIDEFIAGVKAMVIAASDAEFVEFITSGKLDDDDINAVIMFRAEAAKAHNEEACDETFTANNTRNENHEHHVHVIVI